MKNLLRTLLTALLLAGPVLARAGEKDVKASFLLVGGVGGLLIGAGIYAGLLALAAVVSRRRLVLAALVVLSTAVYSYIQYWSVYFLAIATRFLGSRQMRYEFGEPTPLLKGTVALAVVWALLVVGLTLRVWRRRPRPGGK